MPLCGMAQYNTDRLVAIGRSALYYEDYVLSMQYFNQAISVKPYLYEPWYYRGVAKYYLDDFAGAENDCSEAIQRNPYVVNLYELRGLARIQQDKFAEAITDYDTALKYNPESRNMWDNRVLCHIRNKDFDIALQQLDTIQQRWGKYARVHLMRADVYMQQNDTAQAVAALQKSIELDPYDAQPWAALSVISLSREQWQEAEDQLDHAIHLKPKHATYYVNRAMARFHRNNLRGTMADYDMALDLEPNNFIAHYNRGLLRAQVGDDNRAITDFDFVLNLEPDNLMALFNRAVLLDKTGDLRGAIRDYSKVISEYPNFWTGLEYRASCYRRLGMTAKAEADEFTVYKARLYKRLYGRQPRLDPRKIRKRSDVDLDKYNQMVVEDEQGEEPEYASDYRGKVQNRKADTELLPMFALRLTPSHNSVKQTQPYHPQVAELNQADAAHPVYIVADQHPLTDDVSKRCFDQIDSLTAAIAKADMGRVGMLLMRRAVANYTIQNFESAIDDLDACLQIDSTSTVALWQRAVCRERQMRFEASQGTNIDLKQASVLGDLNHAIALGDNNACLYYNRAGLYAMQHDYKRAIADYDQAVKLEPTLGEAYYNRGLCHLSEGRTEQGVRDLSKAGELGIFGAYSIIKQYRK